MLFSVTYVKMPSEGNKPPNIKVYSANLKDIGFDKSSYRHYLPLDSKRHYMLSIKLSSYETGISIASQDFSFVAVFTIINPDKSPHDKKYYENSILDFIRRLILNNKLVFFAAQKSTSQTATIKKILNFKEIRELNEDLKFNPYNQEWKSTFYDKKDNNVSDRFNQKEEIVKDIVKTYPALNEYFEKLKKISGFHFDGLFSFGILTHCRLKYFDNDWKRMNFDSQTQSGLFYVFMKYVTNDRNAIQDEFFKWFLPWSAKSDKNGNPKDFVDVRKWTTDKSIYTNFIMAANSGKIVCMESESNKLNMSYLIETNGKFDKNKCLWIAVCKEHESLIQETHFTILIENGFLCRKYYQANLKEK